MRIEVSKEDAILLKLLKAETKEEAATAIRQYREEVVVPLTKQIEEQKPLVELAKVRLDAKGCFSITDVNKTYKIRAGKITRWARWKGFVHAVRVEITEEGEKYFKVYCTDGLHNQIGITEEGLKLIESNLEEICK